jgi:pyruvate dehydrogenase E2 component (dihydrolipoamide acetyltransferase)
MPPADPLDPPTAGTGPQTGGSQRTDPGRARPGTGRNPLGSVRALAAATTAQSWTTVPQATAFLDIEAEQLLRARERLGSRLGLELPLEALLIRLLLPALDDFPAVNSTVDGDDVVVLHRRSVAFTCETGDGGMATAVVADIERMTLAELAAAVGDLIGRAARGSLTPEEQTGQTFTITDVGVSGASAAIPVLPLGTTGIVAYGRPRNVVRLVSDSPREVPIITLTGSFDHRVIDNHQAARFLARLGSFLEDPIIAFAP